MNLLCDWFVGFSQNMSDIHKLKRKWRRTFILKDFGEPNLFLNMELDWTTERVANRN